MIRLIGSVDGVATLDRAFNRVDRFISDFRNMWPGIIDIFYAAEERLFESEGASGASGKWAPLSRAYAKYKAQHWPGLPILQREQDLVESLTNPDAPDAVFRAEKFELTIGTRDEKAHAHHRGIGVPRRPVISLNERNKRDMQKSIQAQLVQFTRECGFEVNERAA